MRWKNLKLADAATINRETTIYWFRRDLRLSDNTALYYALKENKNVLPIFIFDTVILDNLEDEKDSRVEFIHQAVVHLKVQLEELGSSLLIVHGDPVKIFNTFNSNAVYANHDYEPYAITRDKEIARVLIQKKIVFKTYKDQVIFEKDEILKQDGNPYTVFTPYSKNWKARLSSFYLKSYPTEKYFKNLKRIEGLSFPTLSEIGFQPAGVLFPERLIRTDIIKQYQTQRDFPALQGTTRLSVHLRFGTVSVRKLAKLAFSTNEVWLNELIWREFYHMILWHFPHVATASFKPVYDRIEWSNDPNDFKAWSIGETGYPLVDAGMRELNTTGFMHNRVRMVVASFLTKHLLIDWRWGEAYFAKKLLDFDLAVNNGSWQWAAGVGCDAAPYFRVFNPTLQAEKFDQNNEYIKRWVPELGSSDYPNPIVDHKYARARVLNVYQAALR